MERLRWVFRLGGFVIPLGVHDPFTRPLRAVFALLGLAVATAAAFVGNGLAATTATSSAGCSPANGPNDPTPTMCQRTEADVSDTDDIDLRVDLNTEDDTGLPWAFLPGARDPSLVREGAWLVVGSGRTRAVAQVEGDLVWVRPLTGPVSQYRHLLADRGAA